MREHSNDYKQYINSFDWYLKRRAALERAGHRCQRCGEQSGLEVHHLTYERLGDERDEDLLVVCETCHEEEDAKRTWRVSKKRHVARLDGWATKKYGEDWEDYRDYDDVENEFMVWLVRKEEEEMDY